MRFIPLVLLLLATGASAQVPTMDSERDVTLDAKVDYYADQGLAYEVVYFESKDCSGQAFSFAPERQVVGTGKTSHSRAWLVETRKGLQPVNPGSAIVAGNCVPFKLSDMPLTGSAYLAVEQDALLFVEPAKR